ncbi:MAG: hypothetical protein Kow0020_02930 [Wenzhouxiangellaceae bacterium]
MRAWIIALGLLLTTWAQAAEPARYRVEATAQCAGQPCGNLPTLTLSAGEPGTLEIVGANGAWRLHIEVDEPGQDEGAQAGATWLKVGIEERSGDGWEELTETMLGTPPGQPARLVISEADDDAQGLPPALVVEFVCTPDDEA